MDFSHFFTISGKPGLFKFVGQLKSGIIVESLIDKKRLPAYNNQKIVSLEDISVFMVEEDLPLKDVMKKIYEKNEGKKVALDTKTDKNVLFLLFGEIMPNFDQERVYPSDIKKIYQWYNQLVEHDLISFTDEVAPIEEVAEEPKAPKKTSTKKEAKIEIPEETETKKKTTKKASTKKDI
ncbi:MAG: DUF5606 domain-containing protein [Bacteroidota bacterium]